ncbi:ATP-binding protein [Schlesneria sp. DSM 10557]|uniref:ATP-binding protein n=1 Tax=Schlesneria sp. DSM 10557 TaxID=3044399 RepID=UPI0035A1971C
MARQRTDEKVNIRPEVSILSVLKHLNYKPWFAIAEFVDNAIQSFLANRERIIEADGPDAKLGVAIELDTSAEGRIVIRDNAAGISSADYARAFKPAEVPPDRTGLSEFGMGMKSAACWLASEWTVRTTALGEDVERSVSFDVSSIIQNRIEELDIQTRDMPAGTHYTEITLSGIHKMPQGRTIGKIKEHLAGIYRAFLRDGVLELKWDGEPLAYDEPGILSAPFYRTPLADPIIWRKEIDFDFGDGLRAWGFAALRERASVSSAGFALFRRNRVIQGSGDEGYRPEAIFGKSNSYRYQRLFGELHLEGFQVSHTKDGFRWEEHEEIFLEFLHEHLNADPMPLLTQAEEHRARPSRGSFTVGARAAAERTAEVIERDVPQVIEAQIEAGPDPDPPPTVLPPAQAVASDRTIDVELRGQPWRIIIELTTDPAIGEWVSISDRPLQADGNVQRRCLAVRLSLAHPFTDRFGGTDVARIEPLLRLAAAIGLAETAAREAGVQLAGTFRRNINELLREALSNP